MAGLGQGKPVYNMHGLLKLPEDVLWAVCLQLGWRECVTVRRTCRALQRVVDGVVAASAIRKRRVAERAQRTMCIEEGVAFCDAKYSMGDNEDGAIFMNDKLMFRGHELAATFAERVSDGFWYIALPGGGMSLVRVDEWRRLLVVVATARRDDVFVDISMRISPRHSLMSVHALTDAGVLLLLQYNVVAERLSARRFRRTRWCSKWARRRRS